LRGRRLLRLGVYHRLHVLPLDLRDGLVAVLRAETLEDAAAAFLRRLGQIGEGGRAEIQPDRRRDGARRDALRADHDRRSVVERRSIGGHELGRPGQARKRYVLAATLAEVVPRLPAAVGKRVDVLQLNAGHDRLAEAALRPTH
jgi:hypothetical protein